jgi:hypothetical protein
MRPLFACVAVFVAAGFATADKRTYIPLTDFDLVANDEGGGLYVDDAGLLNIRENGTATAVVEVATARTYKFDIEMSGTFGEFDLPYVSVTINGVEEVGFLEKAGSKVYKFKIDLNQGTNTVVIKFLNDDYFQNESGVIVYDCNLFIHSVSYK